MSALAEAPPAPPALAQLPGSLAMSLRAFRCWLVMYRRTWRSSVWSSVFGPLFYLGAMGYGLGSLVDKNGTGSLGGVRYVVFVAPAILGVQAMNSGLTRHVPGLQRDPLEQDLHRGPGDDCARPTSTAGTCFIAMWIARNSACFVLVMAAFGLIRSRWAVLLPAASLLGVAFATPSAAWAVTLDNMTPMNYVFRFGSVPLMLFSGTFFPVGQLPGWLRPVAYATPLWHGVALCRGLSLGDTNLSAAVIHVAYLTAMAAIGLWLGARSYRGRLYV
jgi:lipooligosaccharide transport system permease protein